MHQRLAALRAHGPAEAGHVLVARDEEEVARELAPHRVGRDRVAGVEGEVGLVGTHLVLVVREVHAPVRGERLERRVREQPLADAVVQPPPGEEQPMRGLVAEDVEQAVPATHPEEREHVRPPLPDPHRGGDDTERLEEARDDRDRAAGVRDVTQRRPYGRHGHARLLEPLGRQDVGEQRSVGQHGRRDGTSITLLRQMTQSRNTDAAGAERPLTARSIIASTLLGTHPPVLRGQLMVRLVELFGVPEGTTRVALVADGRRRRAHGRRGPVRAREPSSPRSPSGARDGAEKPCRPVGRPVGDGSGDRRSPRRPCPPRAARGGVGASSRRAPRGRVDAPLEPRLGCA